MVARIRTAENEMQSRSILRNRDLVKTSRPRLHQIYKTRDLSFEIALENLRVMPIFF